MNDQRNISLSEIGQISVNVHDVDRAVAFYKDTLGIKHLFTVPGRMAFFDCRGIRLMLAIPERPDLDHPSSILYFKVQDIETAHEALVSRKVHFETKPMLVAPMAQTAGAILILLSTVRSISSHCPDPNHPKYLSVGS